MPGWTWDPTADDFRRGFAVLQQYLRDAGSARVPKDFVLPDGMQLGSWVGVQRQKHRRGQLDAERSGLLEALPGWTWNPHGDAFERGIESLRRFVAQHGHANVPQSYQDPDHFRLGTWAGNQRQLHRTGKLAAARVAALESVPRWSWQPPEDFDVGFRHLSDFVAKCGHARVPVGHRAPDGFRLGAWLARRREDWRAGRLLAGRAAALASLPGWTWDPFEDDFRTGLDALRAFVAEYGHARVPAAHVTSRGFRLGRWVQHQRTQLRRGTLSLERIEALRDVAGWDNPGAHPTAPKYPGPPQLP